MSTFRSQRAAELAKRYGLALGVSALGVLVRLALGESLTPFLLLSVPVLVSALFAGLGPGLVSAAMMSLAAAYFFLSPIGELAIGVGGWRQTWWFVVEAALVCALAVWARRHIRASAMREAEARAARQAALEELGRSEHRFRTAIKNSPIMVATMDRDLRYTWIYNGPAGTDSEAWIGKRDDELAERDEVEELLAFKRGVLERRVGERRVIRTVVRGEERWYDVTAEPMWDWRGEVTGLTVATADITERTLGERALAESEELFRLAARATNDAIWDLNLKTGRIRWSPTMSEVYGWKESAEGTDLAWWSERVHPDDLPRVRSSVSAAIEHRREFWRDEYRFRRADGTYAEVLDRGYLIRDKDGTPLRLIGAMQDVTERVRAAAAVRESRAMLQCVLDTIPQGVVWKDRQSRFLGANPVAARASGFERPGDMVGRTDAEMPHVTREQAEFFVRADREVMATGEARLGIVEPMQLPDGSTAWLETNKVPLRDAKGRVIGVLVIWNDITERRRVEEALREANERTERSLAKLDAVLNSMTEGLVVFDANRRLRTVNRAALEVHGAESATLIGRTLEELAELVEVTDVEGNALSVDRWPAGRALAGETFRSYEVRVRRKDSGRTLVCSYGGTPVRDREGRIVLAITTMRDITEEHTSREALRESEERFRQLADSMPQLVWTARPDGAVDYYNRLASDLDGLVRRADGTWEWRMVVHPEDAAATEAAWREAVRTGEPYQIEHRVRAVDGSYHWRLSRAVPVHDQQGRVVKWFGTSTDVDDLKTIQAELTRHRDRLEDLVHERTQELERSHQQLRLAERMAALGTLSMGIGHDLGNLLLPIRARLDSMTARGLPHQFDADLAAVSQAAQYLQSLANGLRLLAGDPETGAGDLTDLAIWQRDAAALLRNALPRRVALEFDIPDDLPLARVPATGLTQAVFNLVQNAGDVMTDRTDGLVRVWAQAEPGGRRVRLGVTDNGPGMSDAVRSRCMEPFFTTKTRAISTGMGLSLVHGVVRRAGGEVKIDSELGRGTTFILALPAQPRPTPGADEPRPVALVTVADGRIRGYATTILETMGYEPKVGPTPGEAHPRLWLADADSVSAERARDFVEAEPGASVVLIGAGSGVAEAHPRVVAIPDKFQPAAVRDAIRTASRAWVEDGEGSNADVGA